MMAQVDVLLDAGHPFSEAAQRVGHRSVDSLNPYMHARGVAYMVDNCSTTARLGSRKWPALRLPAHPARLTPSTRASRATRASSTGFKKNPIHEVLAVCAELRPSVDISVT